MSPFSFDKDFDFISIGDITTDAFIRIEEAEIIHDDLRDKDKIALAFGDKVPYEFVEVVKAVGNSANAAVAASRLGLSSAMVTDIGNDHNGEECRATLHKNGVHTNFVRTHEDKETNYHYVLWFKEERTLLVKHQEYDYNFPDVGNPKWLYFSSVGQNTLDYHKQIIEYLRKNNEVKLAFQPGTFQIRMGLDLLSDLYAKTDILFCNTDEARRILDKSGEKDVKNLLRGIHDVGPNVVVITDGPRGAYVYDGFEAFFMPPFPDPKPPYERTGAGDAFASTFTAAIALGRSLFDALLWAPINSMSVVQYIGAQKGLLTQEEILKYLAHAPANYRPEKIL